MARFKTRVYLAVQTLVVVLTVVGAGVVLVLTTNGVDAPNPFFLGVLFIGVCLCGVVEWLLGHWY